MMILFGKLSSSKSQFSSGSESETERMASKNSTWNHRPGSNDLATNQMNGE